MTRPTWYANGLGVLAACLGGACLLAGTPASAKPAYRQALADYFGPFLAKKLNNCQTCHVPDKPGEAASEKEKPHNAFGARLKAVRRELAKAGNSTDMAARLDAVAEEDSDGDGISNLLEILAGRNPGEADDKPTAAELAEARKKLPAYAKFRSSYPWRPFETVKRPPVPVVKNTAWVHNPIDAFIAAEHEERGLKPRPEATKHLLLRRVYFDLIGLPPTAEEQRAFLADNAPDAYEKVVERLLASPRYGERWGRHWMDVWRYSDVDGTGNQIYSQPHIWRWRDWIIEALNEDKSYDRMILEMLAADELAPDDPKAHRATGFLVRNYNAFYPHAWLQDTVEYTSQALLGVTLRCARCHDHMYDPITQKEYYQVQAIFQPQKIRFDHVPGQPDAKVDGLVRIFDGNPKAETFFLERGDLQRPDKTKPIVPGVPAALGGRFPDVEAVTLPAAAYAPEKRAFVVADAIAASETAVKQAREKMAKQGASAVATCLVGSELLTTLAGLTGSQKTRDDLSLAEADFRAAGARHVVLLAVLRAEALEDAGKKDSDEWKQAATEAREAQRKQAVVDAQKVVLVAQQAQRAAAANVRDTAAKKVADAEAALAKAEAAEKLPPSTTYTKRALPVYPQVSTGRRLAFARWVADKENPLAARVAMNHMWLRHMGQALVPRVYDFGGAGPRPTHPSLLDWLAAEFMERGWSMKQLHRLMVTSSTYRMASTPDEANAALDLDNKFYWRMPSRRLEAEVVRDSLFFIARKLDLTMGGPEIVHTSGLTVPRRSIYFRHADDKRMEFLKIFDGPSALECYQRSESIVPQQALALINSDLTRTHARLVAGALAAKTGNDAEAFTKSAFEQVLCRLPTEEELKVSTGFLSGGADDAARERARENFVHSLMNHYEFRTAR